VPPGRLVFAPHWAVIAEGITISGEPDHGRWYRTGSRVGMLPAGGRGGLLARFWAAIPGSYRM